MNSDGKAREPPPLAAATAEPRTIADDSKTLADSPAGVREHQSAVTVPDHELLSCIGRGSYGEVWLARNVMGTYRAVKIVYRAAFEHARPFEREFNGIQKFEPISRSHDGFVDVLQIGRTPEYFYYVMELADDVVARQQIDPATYEPKTLRSQVQQHKPLPFDQCVELGLSLTAALGHLHQHGLIHRDIKPSNIIFVNGIPKLADIGLVAEQSEAKSFVGTEGFIPPEGPGTPQADIYSLGKVLYEIATGKDRHEFPALPTILGDSATDTHLLELNSVFLRACQTNVKERYQTAAQMREDLLLLRSGKSVKRAQAIERRLNALTRISVLGVGVTLLMLVAFYIAHRQARREALLGRRATASEAAARQNLIQQFVANGNRLAGEGDLFAALPWFVEALRQETDTNRAAMHRLRIGAALHLAPRLTDMWFHDGPVNALQFSRDGRYVASGADDKTARVWDSWTGKPGTPPLIHNSAVEKVDFSPDSKRLLTGAGVVHPHFEFAERGGLGEAKLWDVATGQLLATIAHSNLVSVASFSPDGQTFLTGSYDHTLNLCDAASGQVLRRFDHANEVSCAQFSPDGERIATGCADHKVRIWSVKTGALLGEALQTSNWPLDLCFSPDGSMLLAAGADSSALLVDGRNAQTLRLLGQGSVASVASARFSPDGLRLVLASWDYRVSVWDVPSLTKLFALPYQVTAESSRLPFVASFSPDARLILTICEDHTARLWDGLSGRLAIAPLRHAGPVQAGAFDPGARRVVTGGTDGVVKVWNLASPHSTEPILRQELPLSSATWSPDGAQIVTSATDAKAGVWDAETGRLLTTNWLQHIPAPFAITTADWSRNGKRLLTSGGDGRFRVWETATYKGLTPFVQVTTNSGIFANISPDGSRVVLMENKSTIARVFDAQTGIEFPEQAMRHSNDVAWAAYMHDGKFIQTQSFDFTIRIWEAGTGRLVSDTIRHNGMMSVEESEGSRLLGTACGDGTARVWSVPFGQPVTPLLHHLGGVNSISFSRDGRKAITASLDRTASVWEIPSGVKLLTLEHEAAVNQAQFSPDGRLIGTASDTGSRLWDAQTGEPITPWLGTERTGRGASMFAFSPRDNRFLITGSESRSAHVWDFQPDSRPILELRDWAAFLNGALPGEHGSLAVFDINTLSDRWQSVRGHRPGRASIDDSEALQWHRRQAESCAAYNDSFGLLRHAEILLAANPEDLNTRDLKARALIGCGRAREALAISASALPPRAAASGSQQIDLSTYFNMRLSDDFFGTVGYFKELPSGLLRGGEVDFDVRGRIQLGGFFVLQLGRSYPTKVTSIPIQQRVHKLHFLHATGWEAIDGTEIGRYVLRYSDHETRVLPILYGQDVRNAWFSGRVSDPILEASQAQVAWRGHQPNASFYGASIRLYERTYDNPRPEVEIASLDFESTMSQCNPCLLAITLE
jgi:WD40 repeat protein